MTAAHPLPRRRAIAIEVVVGSRLPVPAWSSRSRGGRQSRRLVGGTDLARLAGARTGSYCSGANDVRG